MAYNDYVILVDENGQPFIAHAFGDRIKNYMQRRKDHKYIQRFDNYWGPGKHAYAYSDAEVKLYSAGRRAGGAARKAVKYIDDHDAGLTERIQARRESRKARKAKDTNEARLRNENANRLRKQAEEEYNRSGVKKAVDAAGSAGRKAAKYIDDHDAGLTERIQARALERKANRVGKKDKDAGRELAAEAARLRRQGKSEYESSNAKKVIDTVTKYGSTSLSAVKATGSKAGSAVSGAASKVGGSVKNAISNAQSTISSVIDRKITGKTAQANMTQATQNAALGLDGSMGEFADAQVELNQALATGTASQIQAATNKLQSIGGEIMGFLNKTGNLFTKDEKEVIERAVEMGMAPDFAEYIYHTKK